MKIKEKKEICKLVEFAIGIVLEGIGSQYNCHITMDSHVNINTEETVAKKKRGGKNK